MKKLCVLIIILIGIGGVSCDKTHYGNPFPTDRYYIPQTPKYLKVIAGKTQPAINNQETEPIVIANKETIKIDNLLFAVVTSQIHEDSLGITPPISNNVYARINALDNFGEWITRPYDNEIENEFKKYISSSETSKTLFSYRVTGISDF